MTTEKNHIENFLHSTLLLRNYAGDFIFLKSVYHQQKSKNLDEISSFATSLGKAVEAVLNFADEAKESPDLGRNYFLISWLQIGSDLDAVIKKLQVLNFLDEQQKSNALAGISKCRKIFVPDFWESLLTSISQDRSHFLRKAAVLN